MVIWIILLSALVWSPSCAGSLFNVPGFEGINGELSKDVSVVSGPIKKTATTVVFGNCNQVKQLLGLGYKLGQGDELPQLSLSFYTNETVIKYKVNELPAIVLSKWYKPGRQLIVYLHGFIDNPGSQSSASVIKALQSKDTDNVLALDASPLIGFFYLRSSTMVRYIGQALGKALFDMMAVSLNPSSIYLVGHSLGSHIAGFAGKTVLALSGVRVGRITGLDPAGPCFSDIDKSLRLSKDDAQYVDVIHTDAGVFGLNDVIGHADYYPNSGSEQVGCIDPVCSHLRVCMYYAESVVSPQGFPAVRCSDWKGFQNGNCDYSQYSYMGFESLPGTTGQFYLQTASNSPFAMGAKGVTRSDEGILRKSLKSFSLF